LWNRRRESMSTKVEEAKKFVESLEGQLDDETERPASHRMSPVNLGSKIVTKSLNDEARIKNLSGKLIAILKERLQGSTEYDSLNDALRRAVGHGLPELEAKSEAARAGARDELVAAVHLVMDWLCSDAVKAKDFITADKLRKAYEEGQEAGRKEAEKAYRAELEKLKDESPLQRTLAERLK
jgi:hypothetical protein